MLKLAKYLQLPPKKLSYQNSEEKERQDTKENVSFPKEQDCGCRTGYAF